MPEAVGSGPVISLADLAEMAGVSRPTVSNWRRRHHDFPTPVRETGAASFFRLSDIERWLRRHHKHYTPLSVAQRLWSALSTLRGIATYDAPLEAAMGMLAALAVARRHHDDTALADLSRTIRMGTAAELWAHLQGANGSGFDRDQPLIEASVDDLELSLPFLQELHGHAVAHGTGELFEALVAARARRAGRADYETPPSLVDLLIQLARPIRGTVYDPACGQGGLLYAASLAAEEGRSVRLVGQELRADPWRVARLRMLAHGLTAEIGLGTAATAQSDEGINADVVLTNPPWGSHSTVAASIAGGPLPPGAGDIAWILHSIERLAPDGRAYQVVPSGLAIRRGGVGEMRRQLVAEGCVHTVITLPRGLLHPSFSGSAMAWITGPPGTAEEIVMIDARHLGLKQGRRVALSSDDISAIAACLESQPNEDLPVSERVPHRVVPIADVVDGEGLLSASRWLHGGVDGPERHRLQVVHAANDLRSARNGLLALPDQAVDSMVTLAAGPGPRITVRDALVVTRSRRVSSDVFDTGDTPLVRAADLNDDWSVTPATTVDPALVGRGVKLTRPGDVLVAVAGLELRAGVDWSGGAITAAPVHILRPRDGWYPPLALAALLTTSANESWAHGSTVVRIDLYGLELPVLDDELVQRLVAALEGLNNQRRAARDVVASAGDLIAGLLDGVCSGTLTLDGELAATDVSL